jgi:hypothetical protein
MVGQVGTTKLITYTMIQNIKNLRIYQIKNTLLVYLIPEDESVADRRSETISNNIDTLTNTIKSLFPSSELEHLTRPGFHKNYSFFNKARE